MTGAAAADGDGDGDEEPVMRSASDAAVTDSEGERRIVRSPDRADRADRGPVLGATTDDEGASGERAMILATCSARRSSGL
jgi:hypothetical protein